MIKEHMGEGKGGGGKSVTGDAPGADKEPSSLKHGVTPQTSGSDPLDRHKPSSVPGHMSQLKQHSGDKVVRGGKSQAGSVGGYLGK